MIATIQLMQAKVVSGVERRQSGGVPESVDRTCFRQQKHVIHLMFGAMCNFKERFFSEVFSYSASSCAVQQRNSIERKNFAKITLMKRNSKSRRQLASVLHAGLFRIIENNVNLVFDVKKRRDPTVTVYYPELRLLTNTRVCTKNFNRNSLEWKYW